MKCCLTGGAVDGDNTFAVAIRKHLPDQLHMGVYCKSEKGESIIHLLGNFRVDKSVSFDKYNYLNFVQLEDEDDVIHMISVAEAIQATKPCEVVYAPCGGGDFDVAGNYQGDVGDGLTCASFVMKLIESQGYELIDTTGWPIRESDVRWQQESIWGLEDEAMTDEDHEHVAIQTRKLEEGAFRFRPEEVGASVTLEDAPNSFQVILPVSLQLIEQL
ncbi:hypothetical protein [Vibrio gigantis]|uniref:hypothetical protein n=1 Tax=Vibrio gigantis TaxID=296199 RepID=UPI001BFCF856|nr:hypothetical protein [Vibrio gigantis]